MMAKTSVSFKLTFLDRGEGRGRGGGGGELFIVKGPVMPGGWEMSIWILLFCVKHPFFKCLYKEQVRKHTWIK